MEPLEQAIEDFKLRRFNVYQADPIEIERNYHAADLVAKDHVGRWLFELLQNCDDAKSPHVKILLHEDTVYVADKGEGLNLKAVDSICSIHFSTKSSGAIGRKGVGFKSVYSISNNPQVLTVRVGGIDFNPDKAQKWLKDNKFESEYNPYQWIPFFVPWDENDSILGMLKDFCTVIALRKIYPEQKQRVEQLLEDWPPHALFAFRYVREIITPKFEIKLSTLQDNTWWIQDSRSNIPEKWKVIKQDEKIPDGLLSSLSVDERKAISDDGISVLVAAPLDNNFPVSTTEYLPIHVFYPTEEKGPVRLLLHAEFLVKSDRTALIPISESHFNAWVADRLAFFICEFVNNAFDKANPSSHVSLLVPDDKRDLDSVAEYLWLLIVDKAKTSLRFADIEQVQRLSVEEAIMLSVSVYPDVARRLFKDTEYQNRILHPSFDKNEEAKKVLKELCCREINDKEILQFIRDSSKSHIDDNHWIWDCWEWLLAWVESGLHEEKRLERLNYLKELPIVPIDGDLLRPIDLADLIICCHKNVSITEVPDWLPLVFVEEWFFSHIQSLPKDSTIKKWCNKLIVFHSGTDALKMAVECAIRQFWKGNYENPEKIFNFICLQNWHEKSAPLVEFRKCPIRTVNSNGGAIVNSCGLGN